MKLMNSLACLLIAASVAHAAPADDLGLMPAFSADQASTLTNTFTAGSFRPPYVPTMAATPAAGTNVFGGSFNVVPTAAANTAALFEPTPKAGSYKVIYNDGPNAVRIKAGGASTINGSAAGAYIPLATKQTARCVNTNGTDWACELTTVPTPAGP